MSNTVSTKELAESVEALAEVRDQIIPRFVTFPADVVKRVLEGDPHSVRFETGLTTGLMGRSVVGFVTPVDEKGEPCGETENSGAPCPPWCPG